MGTSSENHILGVITGHHKDCPIYSAELEVMFDISGSELRKIIRELRREGYPIASSHSGYYYARSYDQIKGTVEDLESRARSLITTASKIKKSFNIQPTLFDNL